MLKRIERLARPVEDRDYLWIVTIAGVLGLFFAGWGALQFFGK